MKTKYSLKSHIYINDKRREIDGPWKDSVNEAIEAYNSMLTKKGLQDSPIFDPFIAESCDITVASCIDSHGKGYKQHELTLDVANKILNIFRT